MFFEVVLNCFLSDFLREKLIVVPQAIFAPSVGAGCDKKREKEDLKLKTD